MPKERRREENKIQKKESNNHECNGYVCLRDALLLLVNPQSHCCREISKHNMSPLCFPANIFNSVKHVMKLRYQSKWSVCVYCLCYAGGETIKMQFETLTKYFGLLPWRLRAVSSMFELVEPEAELTGRAAAARRAEAAAPCLDIHNLIPTVALVFRLIPAN